MQHSPELIYIKCSLPISSEVNNKVLQLCDMFYDLLCSHLQKTFTPLGIISVLKQQPSVFVMNL